MSAKKSGIGIDVEFGGRFYGRIENSLEDLREEGEMLQLRMDQWKVAVNPQVQKAAEAAERSRVVPGVEIADDYEPSREEVAHHWGVSAEKVA